MKHSYKGGIMESKNNEKEQARGKAGKEPKGQKRAVRKVLKG